MVDSNKKVFVYDDVFVFAKTLPQVEVFFEAQRAKSFFGFGGFVEKLDSVMGRFMPVGVFKLTRDHGGEPDSSKRKQGVFYVGLNDLSFFFVHEGFFGKNPSVFSSDFLTRCVDLPILSRSLLSNVLAKGRIPFTSLPTYLSTQLSSNLNQAFILSSRGLVHIEGTHDIVFTSDVNIPEFSDRRFDLSNYLKSAKHIQSDFAADEINHPSEDVCRLLSSVFGARAVFERVTYLPYYVARFVNASGGFRTRILFSPLFAKIK